MDEAKVYYLAGDWKGEGDDQPQTLAWIEPDAEHRFYSENCEWEKMDVGGGSVTHHVTLDNSMGGHMTLSSATGSLDFVAGEQVEIDVDLNGSLAMSGEEHLGWLPTGTPYDAGNLRDVKGLSWDDCAYTFEMPAEDVTVYAVCPGGKHEIWVSPPDM